MNKSSDFHTAAMDCAELALIAKSRRDFNNAKRLFSESLILEMKAINALDPNNRVEPTFSIMHRSAATLALDCNDNRLAEKLIAAALSQDPPPEIGDELRDLLEQVNFRRHLKLRGISLDEDEIQMSLAGVGVGFGVVESEEFLQRVKCTSTMLYRIAERRQRRPFREKGRVKKCVQEDYELFLSVPRAASFAVTMKLGRPMDQTVLPGFTGTIDIVDEFMDLMELVNKGDQYAIENRIPEQAYRTNFVHLAKRLAPDGEKIKIVGFTSVREGREAFVEITRPQKDIIVSTAATDTNIQASNKVTVKGYLKYADATHQDSGMIRIVDETSNQMHAVKVPEGMMNDIVKPLWDSLVTVMGTKTGKYIILEDIEATESN